MSQRLLVSLAKNVTKEDTFFDCIYTENSNLNHLLEDWCCYDKETGIYLGMFKIRIRDKDFWDKFIKDYEELGKYIPTIPPIDNEFYVYYEKKEEKK